MLFSTTLRGNQLNRISVWDIHKRNRNRFTRSPANHIDKANRPAGNGIHEASTGRAVNQDI
jgi:hypothetical protein